MEIIAVLSKMAVFGAAIGAVVSYFLSRSSKTEEKLYRLMNLSKIYQEWVRRDIKYTPDLAVDRLIIPKQVVIGGMEHIKLDDHLDIKMEMESLIEVYYHCLWPYLEEIDDVHIKVKDHYAETGQMINGGHFEIDEAFENFRSRIVYRHRYTLLEWRNSMEESALRALSKLYLRARTSNRKFLSETFCELVEPLYMRYEERHGSYSTRRYRLPTWL